MKQSKRIDYYADLHIPPFSSQKKIKKAFRKLARLLHPDLNPWFPEQADTFHRVVAAYRVLSHEEKRRLYNQEIRQERRSQIWAKLRAYLVRAVVLIKPLDWLFEFMMFATGWVVAYAKAVAEKQKSWFARQTAARHERRMQKEAAREAARKEKEVASRPLVRIRVQGGRDWIQRALNQEVQVQRGKDLFRVKITPELAIERKARLKDFDVELIVTESAAVVA